MAIGLAVLGVAIILPWSYFYLYKTGYLTNITFDFKIIIATVVAVISGAVGVAMVSQWATNSDTTTQFGYLGIPSMDTNPFAWHPILMVGGFFYGQVFAISSWAIFTDKPFAKKVHILFQTISIGSMIAGMCAVVKDSYTKHSESLTTIHSQIGVAAIAMFGFNYLWGSFMAFLTMFYPDSWIRKAIDMRANHKFYGMVALGLIVLSIVTGVMDELGQGTCNYILPSSVDATSAKVYKNPDVYYKDTPTACKLAHTLAFLVILAAVMIVYIIALRAGRSNVTTPVAIEKPIASEDIDIEMLKQSKDTEPTVDVSHVYYNESKDDSTNYYSNNSTKSTSPRRNKSNVEGDRTKKSRRASLSNTNEHSPSPSSSRKKSIVINNSE
eukprot:gene16970-22466_t